ncbi:unnamed protein product [Caenorhabditis angaria]|uniref:WD_REPEATS_REGION domain-containing protein n=1 Tax=Caenorhabditis angaria TaxID=860376 RepID=A0A9P1N0T4_9PELO|nr:unnamed protein product [Caenorhabditis angaria]
MKSSEISINYFYRQSKPFNDAHCTEKPPDDSTHWTFRPNKGGFLKNDDEKIVSGLRDNTIKIWDRKDYLCRMTLTGHTGSVLCLQFIRRHTVLHLRFSNGTMVTCSKDRSIAVWDMVSAREINIRRVLAGHRAAVNVVDFDDRYIVSASGDRTIKVWSMDTLEFLQTLSGHRRGVACLQYRGRLVVSGSSDNTIRLWDIHSGVCLPVLEGHEELVRCIRFDDKRIVSGAYDRKIKVWDLKAALDPRSMPGDICLSSLMQHTGRVFRLQFDDFQIVSSSHDDTNLIWDFLDAPIEGTPPTGNARINQVRHLQQQQQQQNGGGDADNVNPVANMRFLQEILGEAAAAAAPQAAAPQAADNDEESSSNAEEKDDEGRLPGAVFRAAAARPRRRPQAVPREAANNPPVVRNINPYVPDNHLNLISSLSLSRKLRVSPKIFNFSLFSKILNLNVLNSIFPPFCDI